MLIEELNKLLEEIDNTAYQERGKARGKLEQLLMEIQEESELSGEQRLILAKGLCELAAICRGVYTYTENTEPKRAWKLYEQAKAIYDEELGKGNAESWKVALRFSIISIDEGINSAESIQYLQEMLAMNEKNPEADAERIADSYQRMAEISSKWEKDTDKAIAYYQPYLKWAREKYGEESDFVADCYEEIARLCENCDDVLRACEYTERALAINIREMGKMYLLPPIFRTMAVGVMKTIGKIDEEDKFNRIMSVSSNYCNLGSRYLQMNEAQRAKDCLQKSIALYEMEMRVPMSEYGFMHELFGDILLSLEEQEKAMQEFRTAWKIYYEVLVDIAKSCDARYQWEIEECKEGMKRIEGKQQNAK